MDEKQLFETLLQTNVNDLTEEKNGLTYLSWASAWEKFLMIVPDACYKVKMFPDGFGCQVPYCGNGDIGYMVFTEVTANGITRECYLPVMDNNNKTMLKTEYTYKTRSGERTVEKISMFDVNKAIMRCLAKNLAMFGLGLYVYRGEDLPTEIAKPITESQIAEMKELQVNIVNVLKKFNVGKLEDLTEKQAETVISIKRKALEKGNDN